MTNSAPAGWGQGEEVQSSWFKFTKVGDAVYGTLANRRLQPSTDDAFPDQWIYELLTPDKNNVKVGISVKKAGTIDRLNMCQMGEKIGIIFEKELPPAKKGFHPTKVLTVKTFGMDDDFLSGGLAASQSDSVPPVDNSIL